MKPGNARYFVTSIGSYSHMDVTPLWESFGSLNTCINGYAWLRSLFALVAYSWLRHNLYIGSFVLVSAWPAIHLRNDPASGLKHVSEPWIVAWILRDTFKETSVSIPCFWKSIK